MKTGSPGERRKLRPDPKPPANRRPCAGWAAALALWLIGGLILLPLFLPVLNADGVSYVSLAEKYARGEFRDAVNGYWGPLISWMMAPLIAAGVLPWAAARIVLLAAGPLLLWAVRRLARILEIEEPLATILLIGTVPIGLYMVFTMITPDFPVAAILLAYLAVFLDPRFPRGWAGGAVCGLLGALAYFAKPFAFFFFLAHFTAGLGLRWLFRRDAAERRRLVSAGFSGLLVFAVLTGAWIGLISAKYGHLLVNSSGRYNLAYLRPGSIGQPAQTQGFLAPPNPTAVSAWEDPSLIPLTRWNPFESAMDRAHYGRLLWRNAKDFVRSLDDFSLLGPLIYLAAAGLFIVGLIRRYPPPRIRLLSALFATSVLYSAGYLLLLVEDRYLWLDDFLLAILGTGMISFAGSRFRIRRIGSAVLGAVLLASFMILPVRLFPRYDAISTSETLIPARGMHEFALWLGRTYHLRGSFASNRRWNESMFIGALGRMPYYGVVDPEADGREIEAALRRSGIRYFFRWRDQDPRFGFLDKYVELTKGEIKDLKIYLMKTVPWE